MVSMNSTEEQQEYRVTWTDTDGDTVSVTVRADSRGSARAAMRRMFALAGDMLPPPVGQPTVRRA